MFIDISIYGDDEKYKFGYYNEDANIDSLKEIVLNLCNIVFSEQEKVKENQNENK